MALLKSSPSLCSRGRCSEYDGNISSALRSFVSLSGGAQACDETNQRYQTDGLHELSSRLFFVSLFLQHLDRKLNLKAGELHGLINFVEGMCARCLSLSHSADHWKINKAFFSPLQNLIYSLILAFLT